MQNAVEIPAVAVCDGRLKRRIAWMLLGAVLALLAIEVRDLRELRTYPVHVIEVEDGLRVVVGVQPDRAAPGTLAPMTTARG